jgi:predicted nuclease with TOPRIM domain
MARIEAKSSEVVERSCIAELEESNARLQAELDEARARIAEVEGRKNILKSNYDNLCSDYGNFETILVEL